MALLMTAKGVALPWVLEGIANDLHLPVIEQIQRAHVRYRGSTRQLTAVGSRDELATGHGDETRYFIESAIVNGAVKLRLMLSGYVTEDTVLEFQARTALGTLTAAGLRG